MHCHVRVDHSPSAPAPSHRGSKAGMLHSPGVSNTTWCIKGQAGSSHFIPGVTDCIECKKEKAGGNSFSFADKVNST
jgi:hypothetical protein